MYDTNHVETETQRKSIDKFQQKDRPGRIGFSGLVRPSLLLKSLLCIPESRAFLYADLVTFGLFT